MNEIILAPIKESTEDYEDIEKHIVDIFKREIYLPLLRVLDLKETTLKNAGVITTAILGYKLARAGHRLAKRLTYKPGLLEAIQTGRVTFSRGAFYGKFNADISKTLKEHGARWDSTSSTWKILLSDLPSEVRMAISSSEYQFQKKLGAIDGILAKNLPEIIAERFSATKMLDSALWKMDKRFRENVKRIAMVPELTKEQRERIAEEWQEYLERYIKEFTAEKTEKLRIMMKKTVFSGDRYGSAISTIQKSYGVTLTKAKFLARQETGLLMAKYKEVRYSDIGVKKYIWGCVSGTKNHPVRPWHKALEGKTFSWDNPPTTSKPGEPKRANNPGQDYNCRCFARPVVRFTK